MWNSNISLQNNSNYRFDRFDTFSIEPWTKWPVDYTPTGSHERFVAAFERHTLPIEGFIIRRAGLMSLGKKYDNGSPHRNFSN